MIFLVVRKNDSSVFECYVVCHLIPPVYTYSVAIVYIEGEYIEIERYLLV